MAGSGESTTPHMIGFHFVKLCPLALDSFTSSRTPAWHQWRKFTSSHEALWKPSHKIPYFDSMLVVIWLNKLQNIHSFINTDKNLETKFYTDIFVLFCSFLVEFGPVGANIPSNDSPTPQSSTHISIESTPHHGSFRHFGSNMNINWFKTVQWRILTTKKKATPAHKKRKRS